MESNIPQEVEEEEIEKPSILSRIFKGLIVFAVLLGFVYLSGFDQYFFYKRTSPKIKQDPVVSAIDAKEIIVPLSIFIVRSKEHNGSLRTKENVQDLIVKASQIWEQANIELEIKGIYEMERSDDEIALLLDDTPTFLEGIDGYNRSSINVFFTQRLGGINGISFGGTLSIAVADYTTVYDFRALAHEVGHALGLSHVDNAKQLMHQGANGFELSLKEVLSARKGALRF
ncbi:MAG: M12 family metallo-peptidase [bacterium]|nr:M12 family metallo-peptidase [bacterium]